MVKWRRKNIEGPGEFLLRSKKRTSSFVLRQVDAFYEFLRKQLESSIQRLNLPSDLLALDSKKRFIVGHFDSDQSANYLNFVKVANLLRDDCLFVASISKFVPVVLVFLVSRWNSLQRRIQKRTSSRWRDLLSTTSGNSSPRLTTSLFRSLFARLWPNKIRITWVHWLRKNRWRLGRKRNVWHWCARSPLPMPKN